MTEKLSFKMDILMRQRRHGRRMEMGQNRRFRSGQKRRMMAFTWKLVKREVW